MKTGAERYGNLQNVPPSARHVCTPQAAQGGAFFVGFATGNRYHITNKPTLSISLVGSR